VKRSSKSSRTRRSGPRIQDTVRLSADGLAKVLGDLEARIMRVVWDLDEPASAREIHDHVARSHDIAPLTVITVLNRLVEKGLLTRAKRDDVFHYEAYWSEVDFMAHASRRVVEGVLAFGPEVVAASFVDVLAEQDPERLAELARLIRRRLKERDAQ
jgi:predicted transcriptional regulator